MKSLATLAAALKVLLTKNTTLGVWTWNLPIKFACPGCSAFCSTECYGLHGPSQFPSTLLAHWTRWFLTQDLAEWSDRMVAEIGRKRGRVLVRIHAFGDFYSIDYFRAWLDIARKCPNVTFFTYTRTWRLPWFRPVLAEAETVPNFTLWWSTDPSTGIPEDAPRLSYILDEEPRGPIPGPGYYSSCMPAPNCGKQNGPDDCSTCQLCFRGGADKVTFRKH